MVAEERLGEELVMTVRGVVVVVVVVVEMFLKLFVIRITSSIQWSF